MRILFAFVLVCKLLNAQSIEDLKNSVFKALPGISGWCSKEKAAQFIDLVLEVKPDICVEIGVFGGQSLFPVASALKYLDHGIIVGIDPWNIHEIVPYFDPVKEKAHVDWWSKINMEHIYYNYLNTLSQYDLEDYVVTLRTTSSVAVQALSEIDILYIDGNHNESIVSEDVRLYLPKVRKGGYVWLNDSLSSDLQNAVDLLLEQCDFTKLIDGGNCILFKKR
jgi:hypothetical protein